MNPPNQINEANVASDSSINNAKLYFYDKTGNSVSERIRDRMMDLGILGEEDLLNEGFTTDCDKAALREI